MASRVILLEPGTWYAGIHTPWYAPNSAVQSALEKNGLTDIEFHEREEALPAAVNPRSDPRYSDDWDTWVRFRYSGKTRSVTLPHYEFVNWLLVIGQTKPAPGKPPAPKEAPAPAHGLPSLFDPETIGRHLVAGYIAAAVTHNLIAKVVLTLVLDEVLVVAEAKAKDALAQKATA